ARPAWIAGRLRVACRDFPDITKRCPQALARKRRVTFRRAAVLLSWHIDRLKVMFFLISALSALAIGSSVLVAQAVGAGDTAHASRLGRQSLIWSVMCSMPLAVGGYLLSSPILCLFGLEPEVAAIGVRYYRLG